MSVGHVFFDFRITLCAVTPFCTTQREEPQRQIQKPSFCHSSESVQTLPHWGASYLSHPFLHGLFLIWNFTLHPILRAERNAAILQSEVSLVSCIELHFLCLLPPWLIQACPVWVLSRPTFSWTLICPQIFFCFSHLLSVLAASEVDPSALALGFSSPSPLSRLCVEACACWWL